MKVFPVFAAAALVCALIPARLRAESDSFFEKSAALESAVHDAAARQEAAAEARSASAPLLEAKDPRYFDSQIRSALLERLKRNAVTARFAVPTLEADPAIRFDIRDDTGSDKWASYDHFEKVFTLSRNAANQDLAQLNEKHRGQPGWAPVAPLRLGELLDPRQIAVIVDRYLPVIAHEVGGHARHYADLRVLLGKEAANVFETELYALRLEAMAVTWERLARPDYLGDGTDYGDQERRMADAFAKSFKKSDSGVFGDYVKKTFGDYDHLAPISGLSDEELIRLGSLTSRARVDCGPDIASSPCQADFDALRKYLPERGREELDKARKDYQSEPKRTTYREAVLKWIARAEPRTGDSPDTLMAERGYFRQEQQRLDAAQSEIFSPSNLPASGDDDAPDVGRFGGRGRF